MENKMPEGFFWGNSTSSMQTEGGWNEGGKGQSVYDVDTAGRTAKNWQITIDNFHDYQHDFDLMKEMNMNMYRFQISWSRVVPDGDGDFNEEGIAFYSEMIDELLSRGIEPMICLYHFDMPLVLAEKYNGFLSRAVEEAFVRFGKEMIRRFSSRVKYWIVFNEHNLYFAEGFEHYSGVLKKELTVNDCYTVFHHTMLAHCELADFLHEISDAKIGGMLATTEVYPASTSPKDSLYLRKFDEFYNRNLCDVYAFGHYSDEVLTFIRNHKIEMDFQKGDELILERGISDFISFSYYRSVLLDATTLTDEDTPNFYLSKAMKLNPLLSHNRWGWSIDPEGFRNILNRIYREFGLPVFPIENGIGQDESWDGEHEIEDDVRINYHKNHIEAMKNAMFLDGVDVIGYLGWGLIDIPASGGNIDKRYGAVYVEPETLKRVPKKSFHWFKKVFGSNGDEY